MSCGSGACGSCGGSAVEPDSAVVDVESLLTPPSPPTPFISEDSSHLPSSKQPLLDSHLLHSLQSRIHSAAVALRELEGSADVEDEEATSALMQTFSDIGWTLAGENAQAVKVSPALITLQPSRCSAREV